MNSTRAGSLAIFGALAATAAFSYFGTGLHPVWWLTWLAAIPVLLLAPRVSGGVAFGAATAAWAIGALNGWHFFRYMLEVPLPAVVIFTIAPAVIFGLCVLAYRAAYRKSAWRAALIFPAAWASCEYLVASFSIHGTAGNLGYSQMNFLPVLQIASVTGIWGVSFCMFLFAATVSVLIGACDRDRRDVGTLAAVTGVFFAIVLGFGVWRVQSAPAGNTVEAGLIASDQPQHPMASAHDDVLRLMREYAAEAEKLAAQGAKVIVIPEKIAVVPDAELKEIDGLFSALADKTGASIVIGIVHPTNGAKWNEARFYSPGGTLRTYEKHHMLPPFESPLKPGTERTVWQEASGRWGMTICKDMDFPKLSREYGRDQTALLLVPAWDFVADSWLHGRMAILRGVESGFSIVRAPRQGILTVTDDRGRVLAEKDTSTAPFVSLVAAVPVHHDQTIYDRFGDWFAWLNIVIVLVIVPTGLWTKPTLDGGSTPRRDR